MRYKTFGDFIDKKKRESIKQLGLVEQLLGKKGFRVENHLSEDNDDEPYIFCYNPFQNTSFDGIRIYKIGNQIAFRVQKESKTHPYGSAYSLNVENMFHDFLSDEGVNEQQAAMKVIEAVAKDIRRFFEKSLKAEREGRKSFGDEGKNGELLMRTTGTDYSSLIFNKS